ncbi:unnamed protein product [Amoebophrya sp. A120]|nr:unnamed protein product [Amoebophrya sp. A120]|eukprot:GSA120T00011501001.1
MVSPGSSLMRLLRRWSRSCTFLLHSVLLPLRQVSFSEGAVRMERIFPYENNPPAALDVGAILNALPLETTSALDTAAQELARGIAAVFFNGTGLEVVWEDADDVSSTTGQSGLKVPRFRYAEIEEGGDQVGVATQADGGPGAVEEPRERSSAQNSTVVTTSQAAAGAGAPAVKIPEAASGSSKADAETRRPEESSGTFASLSKSVFGWFTDSTKDESTATPSEGAVTTSAGRGTSAPEDTKPAPDLGAGDHVDAPRLAAGASSAEVAPVQPSTQVEQKTSSDPGVPQTKKKEKLRYPKEYLNFCILGIGKGSIPLLTRYFEFFPQISFWVFVQELDWDLWDSLVAHFPKRKINVEYDDRIPRLKPRCHILAFGMDSVEFTISKVSRFLFTKTDQMLLVWQTHGCGKPGALEWNPECAYLHSQWTSTLCGRQADLDLTPEQAQMLRETRYGALEGRGFADCTVGQRLGDRPNSWAVRKRREAGEVISEDEFENANPLTAGKPLCLCLVDRLWMSDLYYEKPICEEFEQRKLPPGRRIYARHTENWYDPLKDFFFGYGQWSQDWFLYNNFFRHKKKGFFVDIGAMAPFELSNTAVFEQCFDWEGLCVEPNPSQHLVMLGYRPKCRLVPFCLGDSTGKRKTFALQEGSTGHARVAEDAPVAETKEETQKAIQDWLRGTDHLDTFQSECISLEDMLRYSGVTWKTPIDFVSIDIEGGEFEILKNFPFDKFTIHAFLIEAGHDSAQRIDILLLGAKYVKMAVVGKDQVYVHQEYLHTLTGNYLLGETDMNPYELVYPPYINIDPYNDTFDVFQRRFLDSEFGK